ncbi:MAG: hypothetical protein RI985_494 [Chloroflexota bacterium]|jgi:hypothetical protein
MVALMNAEIAKYFPFAPNRFDYLVNVSPRFKYVYIETPKVACSTVKYHLQMIEFDEDERRIYRNVHDRAFSPIRRISELNMTDEQLNDVMFGPEYFHFMFVRNPYTRTLSCYLDKFVKGSPGEVAEKRKYLGYGMDDEVSYIDFLRAVQQQPLNKMDIHWTPQTYLLGVAQGYQYDFIGRFENFDADLARALRRVRGYNKPFESIQKRQYVFTEANQKVLQYYTPEAKKLVEEIYADDFIYLGYGRGIDLL